MQECVLSHYLAALKGIHLILYASAYILNNIDSRGILKCRYLKYMTIALGQ